MAEDLRKQRYIFVGDRAHVLDYMLTEKLNIVEILYSQNSFLERYLESKKLPGRPLKKKADLVAFLQTASFDYLVCNGLTNILPVSRITGNSQKKLINIHPSFLPDLKGKNPVQAAIMNKRESGATCHVMDDGIDTGPIIAQTKIPYSECLDGRLLFHLTFMAERIVFEQALVRGFIPDPSIDNSPRASDIYYTFSPENLLINFDTDIVSAIQKIKAFNTSMKKPYFMHNGKKIIVQAAKIIDNEFVRSVFHDHKNKTVVMKFENQIVIKLSGGFLALELLELESTLVDVGAVLG